MIGIHENGELRALNNGYTLGSGGGSGTPIPTANTNAQFDNDAHMNSTDMTTGSGGEVEEFIDGLNVSGGGEKLELFTATRNSSSADGTFTGVYYPNSGIVTFAFTIRFTSNVGTSTALFTIPEKYRPKADKTVPMVVFTDANVPVAYSGIVYTTGNIGQNATGYCRQVLCSGSYSIE